MKNQICVVEIIRWILMKLGGRELNESRKTSLNIVANPDKMGRSGNFQFHC